MLGANPNVLYASRGPQFVQPAALTSAPVGIQSPQYFATAPLVQAPTSIPFTAPKDVAVTYQEVYIIHPRQKGPAPRKFERRQRTESQEMNEQQFLMQQEQYEQEQQQQMIQQQQQQQQAYYAEQMAPPVAPPQPISAVAAFPEHNTPSPTPRVDDQWLMGGGAGKAPAAGHGQLKNQRDVAAQTPAAFSLPDAVPLGGEDPSQSTFSKRNLRFGDVSYGPVYAIPSSPVGPRADQSTQTADSSVPVRRMPIDPSGFFSTEAPTTWVAMDAFEQGQFAYIAPASYVRFDTITPKSLVQGSAYRVAHVPQFPQAMHNLQLPSRIPQAQMAAPPPPQPQPAHFIPQTGSGTYVMDTTPRAIYSNAGTPQFYQPR